MIRIRLLIITLIVLISIVKMSAQSIESPEFKFEETKHDFGDMNQGVSKEHEFKFTNVGKEPLIISKVLTTCGCTAPTWPKEPIQPNAKGSIKIVFNSTGKIGKQNKVITILANTDFQKFRLSITANVLPNP